jgi:hypothetical protein
MIVLIIIVRLQSMLEGSLQEETISSTSSSSPPASLWLTGSFWASKLVYSIQVTSTFQPNMHAMNSSASPTLYMSRSFIGLHEMNDMITVPFSTCGKNRWSIQGSCTYSTRILPPSKEAAPPRKLQSPRHASTLTSRQHENPDCSRPTWR